MAVVLFLAGSVLGDGHLVMIACVGVAFVFVVKRLAALIARILKTGKAPASCAKWLRQLKWVLAGAVTLLVIIGLLYFGTALHDLAHRIHASWHNLVES
jgi:hypothetical protein